VTKRLVERSVGRRALFEPRGREEVGPGQGQSGSGSACFSRRCFVAPATRRSLEGGCRSGTIKSVNYTEGDTVEVEGAHSTPTHTQQAVHAYRV